VMETTTFLGSLYEDILLSTFTCEAYSTLPGVDVHVYQQVLLAAAVVLHWPEPM
jgi:hypothetical protein